jgi:diketogulonate reductase-like aldo/keto reductase
MTAPSTAAPGVALPSGQRVPALGLGTWKLGETRRAADREISAVRHAIDLGYRLFDTAEMYGEGGAETVLGSAITDALRTGAIKREEIVLVSKVYPHHASRKGVPVSCDRSRKRLGVDTIDLYLLHWRGTVPLAETVDAFEAEKAKGTIGEWGVSNFDIDDLIDLDGVETRLSAKNKLRCATNQVYYALDERGPDFSLTTYQRTRHMPLMAYCPLGGGTLPSHPALTAVAQTRGATNAQIALAWTMRNGDVIAIPKAADHAHLAENFAAASITLTDDELVALDAAFPAPIEKRALAMV